MKIAGASFVFHPVLSIACAAAIAFLLTLGQWQLNRRDWKETLIASVDARVDEPAVAFLSLDTNPDGNAGIEYTPAFIDGEYVPDLEERVFGQYDGKPGIFIFTPMKITGGQYIYINRGFVEQITANAKAFTPANQGEITRVTGLIRYRERPTPPASWFRTNTKSSDGLWLNRDPLAMAEAVNLNASPYYLERIGGTGDERPLGGTTRLEFRNKHMEYALTWFGLAATLLGVFLGFSLKKDRTGAPRA